MNLIERYVTEVGKHLPRKNRLDIETELRSTLEDMLEDRSQQAERPADEALIEELLREYGAPRDVAATYQTHPYLIGPRMFNLYTLLLKIVFFAVTLSLTIATVVSLISSSMTSPEVLESFGKFIASLVSALVAAFGSVTLTFAILERVMPDAVLEGKEEWTPADLTNEPDPGQVKAGDMIASIVFTVGALMIFNFYPQIVGIWNLENAMWVQLAGLSDVFFRYLPWINLSAILTILLDIWLLRQGIWNPITRWLHIGLQIIGIAIAAAMLREPSLITFTPNAVGTEVGGILKQVFGPTIPIILLIVIIVNIVEIVKDIVHLLHRDKSGFPFKKVI